MLIDSIKDQETIDIQVNGSFYRRIQALFFYLVEGKDPQYINQMINKINEGTADNEVFSAHLQTVIVLMREIEEQAKVQNKITKTEIAPEDLNKD